MGAGTELYPGERIEDAAGYPVLLRHEPGATDRPLVVFITGGGVLARVAYGPPDARPADFLLHWLKQAGYPALALSYPMANPAFGGTFPGFGMLDWAAQSAAAIARLLDADALPRRVLVLGWSMAGRIAHPLASALNRLGITLELFVGLAASTPLPNLLPGLAALQPTPAGLAGVKGGYLDWLLACLADQNAAAGHVIVEPQTFAAQFAADFPIGLAASAMRYRDGGFVPEPLADAREIGAADYAGFPPLALMTHDSALDARHALMDRAGWGFYITQQIIETMVLDRPRNLAAAGGDRWPRVLSLVHGAAGRLTAVLPGNHMFFVGEAGARETVAALADLQLRSATLRSEITAELG